MEYLRKIFLPFVNLLRKFQFVLMKDVIKELEYEMGAQVFDIKLTMEKLLTQREEVPNLEGGGWNVVLYMIIIFTGMEIKGIEHFLQGFIHYNRLLNV